jgi:hypothetical protein
VARERSTPDPAGWEDARAVADSLTALGLDRRPGGDGTDPTFDLGDGERLVLALGDDGGPESLSPGEHVLATSDFRRFTFRTPRSEARHGRGGYRRFAFERDRVATDGAYAASVVERLREVAVPASDPVALYDDRPVLAAFHDDWTDLRGELTDAVAGIPPARETTRRRFVDVRFRRLLFARFLDGSTTLLGPPFRRSHVEREFPDARLGPATERRHEPYDRMRRLLDRWETTVDERAAVEPRTLSPAALGYVFERSVERRERGTYYTPPTVTGFMARRAVRQWLLDRVATATGRRPDSVDAVLGIGEADPAGADPGAVEALLEAALDCRVLDPAVGGGAFLIAAGEVLLDAALGCLRWLRDAAPGAVAPADGTAAALDRFDGVEAGTTAPVRRHLAGELLHGVDVDPEAAAICRQRLLLWVLAGGDGATLPDLSTTVRQGNALVGATALPWRPTDDGDPVGGADGALGDLAAAVTAVRDAGDPASAGAAREALAAGLADRTGPLDDALRTALDAGDVAWLDPFHWPLEFPVAHLEGGFDVVLGNPPWDVVKADRDRFFPALDPEFRTRPPAEKDERQAALLEDPDVAERWERFRREQRLLADYFDASGDYRLQDPTVDGRAVGSEHDLSMLFLERVLSLGGPAARVGQFLPGNVSLGASAKDLRTQLLGETEIDHLVGFENTGLVQGLHRQYKLCVVGFRNCGATESLRVAHGAGDSRVLRRFDECAVGVPADLLASYSPAARTFPFLRSREQVDLLADLVGPPPLGEQVEGAWFAEPYTELHRAQDTDRFESGEGDYPVYGGRNVYQFVHDDAVFEDIEPPSLWSVTAGRDPCRSARRRIRERAFNGHDPRFSPKPAVYEAFDGSGSQRAFVDDLLREHRGEGLSLDDVLLDCTAYRIVYREIANATNERGMVAAVVPPGVVCHHKLHTVRPYVVEPTEADLSAPTLQGAYERVFTDRELFAAVGLLNSLPFDYLLRSKLDTSVVMYKFRESQLPRLTAGDRWFDPVASRAARLNCYGGAFAPMRDRLGGVDPVTDMAERRRVQTELEAAACHAYGLDREQVGFLLSDFHTVERPRLVDDDYLDAVAAAFDRLADGGG